MFIDKQPVNILKSGIAELTSSTEEPFIINVTPEMKKNLEFVIAKPPRTDGIWDENLIDIDGNKFRTNQFQF